MIKQQSYTCNVDIWSLGICLVELLVYSHQNTNNNNTNNNQSPFHPNNQLKWMYTAATVGVCDQIPATASPEVRNFLIKCLEVDGTKRICSSDLAMDPYVRRTGLSDGFVQVLSDIFINNTLNTIIL